MKLQQIIIRVNFILYYVILPKVLKIENKFYYQNCIILKSISKDPRTSNN